VTPQAFFAIFFAVIIVASIVIGTFFQRMIVNPPIWRKYSTRPWGRIVQLALEDPETRAAIFDAMEQERIRRERGGEKPKRKQHD